MCLALSVKGRIQPQTLSYLFLIAKAVQLGKHGLNRPLLIIHIWDTDPDHQYAALGWLLLLVFDLGDMGRHRVSVRVALDSTSHSTCLMLSDTL